MKKIAFILMTVILLAGGTVAVVTAPSYAQDYEYPAPPPNPYESPWVGPDTPWVYYNGDWFLNGTLYYYFGPEYGWAPYYAYAPNYIVRPNDWYAPRWLGWYQGHPQYYTSFQREYPYWREHREGRHYDQRFYEQHHQGQGGGWQKGFHGGPAVESRHEGGKQGQGRATPSERLQQPQREQRQPAAQREQQPQQRQPAVQREQQPQQGKPAMQHEQQPQREQRQPVMQREQQPKQGKPAAQQEQQPQQRKQQQQQGGDKEKQ